MTVLLLLLLLKTITTTAFVIVAFKGSERRAKLDAGRWTLETGNWKLKAEGVRSRFRGFDNLLK